MNIKKIAAGTVTGIVMLGSIALPAFAAPNNYVNTGSQLNSAAACDTSGNPVVNVNYKITNDADSALGGNMWALDS
ncbi:MAG: hypothetical protein KGL95_14785, partial [Patescibacteria group bacterium]|nr:hypothetical protein [Patescibacteria group bacterium]